MKWNIVMDVVLWIAVIGLVSYEIVRAFRERRERRGRVWEPTNRVQR